MKVAITVDLTPDQRIAVGLIETGEFVQASREMARKFVTKAAVDAVKGSTQVVERHRKVMLQEITGTTVSDE